MPRSIINIQLLKVSIENLKKYAVLISHIGASSPVIIAVRLTIFCGICSPDKSKAVSKRYAWLNLVRYKPGILERSGMRRHSNSLVADYSRTDRFSLKVEK